MKKNILKRFFTFAACPAVFLFMFSSGMCLANNISVINVSLTDQSVADKTAKVMFDIAWENSWRNNVNHDAAWVFVKYSKDQGATWDHATLKAAGVNPTGVSQGAGTVLEIVVPGDLKGAFLRRAENGAGAVATTGIKIVWDWNADGLSSTDLVRVRVSAIEMVYAPEGSFYAGDFATSAAALKKGSADTNPWQITSENSIAVTAASSNGYYYVSGANTGEDSTGAAFTISASFPKGYKAFYAMKYEISEGQWSDFFSTLSAAQKSMRDITSSTGKNSDIAVDRNTVSWSSGDAMSARPDRACSFISWMDLCAYADWAGLRPLTELEYEKMCRGTNSPVSGEYAWGSTSVAAAINISGTENGMETITNTGGNACYNDGVFSGGDEGRGPLRSGIFATGSSNRASAGAGYYGNMELSGNLSERVVTIGNPQGRNFTGTHGDGLLTITQGYEGNATNADWPGIDSNPANGITGAAGTGFRGGDWESDASLLRASDRSKAALTSAIRVDNYGGRCARTAP